MGASKGKSNRSIKEPIAGPWDWRSHLPRCDHELNDLRIRAAEEAARQPQLGIHLGRFLAWVDGQARGLDVGPTGNSVLARYRRFLFDLANVDHEPPHEVDDIEDLPCALHTPDPTAAAA